MDFQEDRHPRRRGLRRGLLFTVVALAIAACATCAVWRARTGKVAETGESAAANVPSGEIVSHMREVLLKNGISAVFAEESLATRLSEASSNDISAAYIPRTALGYEFTPLPFTAWLIPDSCATNAIRLFNREGVRFRRIDLQGYGIAAIPVSEHAEAAGDHPPPSGIFFDFTDATTATARFVPTDNWVEYNLSRMGPLSTESLAPVVERARDSLLLLRFLFENVTGKARDVILRQIRDMAPLFASRQIVFGDNLVFLGPRLTDGEDDGRPHLRLYFSIPSGASDIIPDSRLHIRFQESGNGHGPSTFVLLSPENLRISAFSTNRDSALFSVSVPLEAESDGGRFSFILSVERPSEGSFSPMKFSGGMPCADGSGAIIDMFDAVGGDADNGGQND